MQLNASTEAALGTWLGPSTWDSDHPADRERFHRFVNQYAKDHGHSMSEPDMRDAIRQRVQTRGHPFGKHQEELVFKYVAEARTILEFLEHSGR
jgi:hypothetical protein